MRRKEKYVLTGATVVFSITMIADLIVQYFEQKKKGLAFSWKEVDFMRSLKRAFTGGVIGGIGGFLLYQFKLSEEREHTFNTDKFLKRVLNAHSLQKNQDVLQPILKKRKELKTWLENTFGSSLVGKPKDAGSFFRRTAISSNSDLDIVLPFKKTSYSSLEEMYYDVYDKINARYGSTSIVEKKRKSISIVFTVGDIEIYVDVVPGREIDNYKKEKDLNLFVRADSFWEKDSSFKTNLYAHNNLLRNKPEVRRVIKLTKIYRDKNNLQLPSIIIDQLVNEAFEKGNFLFNGSDYNNFLNSLEYISKKLSLDHKVIDISNTNNDIGSKIDGSSRDTIINLIEDDLDELDENPRYLTEMF